MTEGWECGGSSRTSYAGPWKEPFRKWRAVRTSEMRKNAKWAMERKPFRSRHWGWSSCSVNVIDRWKRRSRPAIVVWFLPPTCERGWTLHGPMPWQMKEEAEKGSWSKCCKGRMQSGRRPSCVNLLLHHPQLLQLKIMYPCEQRAETNQPHHHHHHHQIEIVNGTRSKGSRSAISSAGISICKTATSVWLQLTWW